MYRTCRYKLQSFLVEYSIFLPFSAPESINKIPVLMSYHLLILALKVCFRGPFIININFGGRCKAHSATKKTLCDCSSSFHLRVRQMSGSLFCWEIQIFPAVFEHSWLRPSSTLLANRFRVYHSIRRPVIHQPQARFVSSWFLTLVCRKKGA